MSDAAPQIEHDPAADSHIDPGLSPQATAAQKPTVSVVAPAYNEVDNLTPLVQEVVQTLSDTKHTPFEVLIVDDGSTDGTRDALYRLSQLFDSVRGITLARNYGQSAALAAGFKRARGEKVVAIDADGQNDPADIPHLLDELEHDGYDCVSGWREDRDDPWHKRWPSAIQTRLAKRLGPDINDFGCTLKAYRAEALQDIDLWGEGHRYIPAQLYDRGYSIGERRVNHRPRQHGNSHYGVGRLVRGFVDLLFHYFNNRYGRRPMHLFGALGLILLGVGAAIGIHLAIMRFGFGVAVAPKIGRLLLSALLILSGLLVVAMGLLSELLTRLRYREEQPFRVEQIIE